MAVSHVHVTCAVEHSWEWLHLNPFPFKLQAETLWRPWITSWTLHKFLYVSNLTFIQKQAFNILSQTDIEISWVYETDTFHDPLTNYCAVTTIGAFYICWPQTKLTYLSSHDFRLSMTFLSYPFSFNSDLSLLWNSELVFIEILSEIKALFLCNTLGYSLISCHY